MKTFSEKCVENVRLTMIEAGYRPYKIKRIIPSGVYVFKRGDVMRFPKVDFMVPRISISGVKCVY